MRSQVVLLLALGLLALGQPVPMAASRQVGTPQVTAVRAERIITISGEEIRDGVILVRDGRIAEVGQEVAIPDGATVLEAAVVMPGMVEAHTSRGMDSANENVPVVPFVNTADGVDPLNIAFEEALRDGITSIHVIPGNNTVIGGTGIVMKPVGGTVEATLVKRPTAMKISFQPSGNRNRISQVQAVRRAFEEFQEYYAGLQERRSRQREQGEPEEEPEPRQRAMVDLVEGRLTAFIYCPRAADVPRALELIEEWGLKAVLVLGADGYKAAWLLQGKGIPVVLAPQLAVWETDEDEDEEVRHYTPFYFSRAGVPFALQAGGGQYGARYLWYQAAVAVRGGVPRADALRAITLTPAEILGMEEEIGSIEVGKRANLLLLTGDPFDVRTWLDTALVEGEVVYERRNDPRLQYLLTGRGGDA